MNTASARQPPGVDTGRLRTGLHPEAHRIVYDAYLPSTGPDSLGEELRLITEVDRAHLVMLAERGIVPVSRAVPLLRAIEELHAEDFGAVRELPMPRGVYLAYEGLLIERLGEHTGGVLHTGRSRNDLNATTVRLRTRLPYAELLEATCALASTLLERAERYQDVTMPAYTHGQPAVPITYGHYLTGVAQAVLRALAGLLDAGGEIDVNPLGAGAVGGTSIPIDPRRTGALLGFSDVAPNSVDAVASRDFVLRLLSSATVLGVVMARLARDLSTWTSEESGLVRMSDDLVGSSSMMPQKRNPFLLEHIQGRATAGLGGFAAATAAMATAGYTNAIAVGTEAVRHLWPGLEGTTESATLMRLVVAGTAAEPRRMAERAEDGFTPATYLAERLVADGMPFRSAHHLVGRTVLDALESGVSLPDTVNASPELNAALPAQDPEWLRPGRVAAACSHGGGPGGGSAAHGRDHAHGVLASLRAEVSRRTGRWNAAEALLAEAVHALRRDR